MSENKQSALAVMAGKFSVDPDKLLGTLKSTVFKGASNEELLALVVVANTYGLNPLTKEIYAFPAKGGGIVPVVSIDGWLNLINSNPQMNGLETNFDVDANGALKSCTCIIWRKDREKPTIVTEYLAECKRNTDPWKMEHRMLRHKAIIQCARVAFGFSGIYDEDEARVVAGIEKIAAAKVVESAPVAPAPRTATPQEGLRNLCKASLVEESELLAYAVTQGVEAQNIEGIPDDCANLFKSEWADVTLPAIQANKA